MTALQLQYRDLQEQKRSNLAKEAENVRSNLAKEDETRRSNLAKESETQRHNVKTEKQTDTKMLVDQINKVSDTFGKLLGIAAGPGTFEGTPGYSVKWKF